MNRPQQRMERVKSGRDVVQSSNVATDQTMADIEAAGDVQQLIAAIGNDTETISAELRKLHAELVKYDPNATAELQSVKNAEEAARHGDSAGIVLSLKGVARWVVDFAKKLGISVVAKIIEKQIGL